MGEENSFILWNKALIRRHFSYDLNHVTWWNISVSLSERTMQTYSFYKSDCTLLWKWYSPTGKRYNSAPCLLTVLMYLKTTRRGMIMLNLSTSFDCFYLTETVIWQQKTPAPPSFHVTLHFLRACVFASLRQLQRTMAFAGMLNDEDIKAAVQACQSESDSTHTLARRGTLTFTST